MRVMQLISSNGLYGAEGVVLSLSKELMALGIDVRVCVFNASGAGAGDFAAELRRRGIAVVDAPCSGRMDLSAIMNLKELIRTERIDLLHTHGYKANFYGLAAARLAGVKIIATCHNWTERSRSLRLYTKIDKWLLRRFDAVAAVSGGVSRALRDGAGLRGRLRVIENGVDLHAYREPVRKEDRRVIGAVTRLSTEKGVDVLLRAIPAVLARFPSVRFLVAGEGPERGFLEGLAKELGITHALELVGFCSDVPGFLSGCEIVAHPSRMEGLPLAILEAMAAAKPIVASAVGSIPMLLEDGRVGMLVRADDAVALSAAINGLLEDPDFALSLGAIAREAVKPRSAEGMARAYVRVYESLTGARTDQRSLPVRTEPELR